MAIFKLKALSSPEFSQLIAFPHPVRRPCVSVSEAGSGPHPLHSTSPPCTEEVKSKPHTGQWPCNICLVHTTILWWLAPPTCLVTQMGLSVMSLVLIIVGQQCGHQPRHSGCHDLFRTQHAVQTVMPRLSLGKHTGRGIRGPLSLARLLSLSLPMGSGHRSAPAPVSACVPPCFLP